MLERNARIGKLPTEDTVTRAEAAQIDMALLENPALIALKPDDEFGAILDSQQDDASKPSCAWWTSPRKPDVHRRKHEGRRGWYRLGAEGGSEWVYRQTMSRLLRSMRLPYRFDVDFRCTSKTAIWPSVSPLPAFP